jgi:hypothetical protein
MDVIDEVVKIEKTARGDTVERRMRIPAALWDEIVALASELSRTHGRLVATHEVAGALAEIGMAQRRAIASG